MLHEPRQAEATTGLPAIPSAPAARSKKQHKMEQIEQIQNLKQRSNLKNNRSTIPIPAAAIGAQKQQTLNVKRRITGKQKDKLAALQRRTTKTQKPKKDKKSKKNKKPSINTDSPPKLPCKTVRRFKPQRGAYIMDAADTYIIGCSHTAAHTLIRNLCTKLNSGKITSRAAAMTELHLQKKSAMTSGIEVD